MTQNQLLSPNDLRDRDAWRKACTNLFFFATNVGSQAFQDKFQDFGKMHLKMCYHLDTRKNPNLRKYMSVFRGGYKTTVLLAYFVWFFVWNIVKKQSNAIIYNTATKENAWNFQADIKHFLLENELLQWIFPELPHAEKDYKYLTKNRIENNRVRIDFGSLETTLVSRHYSIWCLLPGNLVYTSNGLVPIEDVLPHARVLNRSGHHTEVLSVSEKPNEEKALEISIVGVPEKLRLTESHRVLSYSDNRLDWTQAGKLSVKDYVAMPIPRGHTRAISRTNKKINTYMENTDFWRFIGYWLAEGCATPDKNRVRLTFGKDESNYVEDVKFILGDQFGIKINVHPTKSSTIMVDFSDPDVKEILSKFGTHSYNKHIPPMILSANEKKQRELILGYFRGDGSKIKSSNNFNYAGWSAVSVSRSLLAGIQLILANNGIVSSINLTHKSGINKIMGITTNARDAYAIIVASPLMDIIMGSTAVFPTRPNQIKLIPGYILFPIKDIKPIEYDGLVYDLTVSDGESFVVPGAIVHNCNDDMENDENSKTEYMREDLIRKWKYQKAILTKVKSRNIGTEIEVGTPYHVQGLTWKIRNSPSFDRLEIPCYIDRDKTKGVSFPERYTVGDFEEIAKDLGPTIFSAQYLLNALAEEDSLCPEKWIRYWDRLPENRWRTLVIDPGGSGSSSDPTGVTVVDTDENGILYVVHADEYRFTPMELINHIDEWKRQYRPDDIRIEKDRYATTIADMFVHKFPLLNVSYVEHGGRGKEENRIWRLKQWFENKRILIGRNQHNFRQQLLEYPSSKHDDMLDSLAYHLDIRRTPAHKKRMYLPSGKEFFPNVTQDFSDEMDAVLRNRDMKSNEEARYNDTLY